MSILSKNIVALAFPLPMIDRIHNHLVDLFAWHQNAVQLPNQRCGLFVLDRMSFDPSQDRLLCHYLIPLLHYAKDDHHHAHDIVAGVRPVDIRIRNRVKEPTLLIKKDQGYRLLLPPEHPLLADSRILALMGPRRQ